MPESVAIAHKCSDFVEAIFAERRKGKTEFLNEDMSPLYHKERYREFSETIGAKVTQSAVQVSLNRVRERGLLIKAGHGLWDFESAHFKAFVQDQ